MHAAVAALQMAARRLQFSTELDAHKYGQMVEQLREVRDQLAAFERRVENQKADPVNLSALLAEMAGAAANEAAGNLARIPAGVMVAGPIEDLRDLFGCLIEFALGVAAGPLQVEVGLTSSAEPSRQKCIVELTVQSPDVPDFLRRKLWEAARARRGEVSVTAEPTHCRVGLTLPVERRLAS